MNITKDCIYISTDSFYTFWLLVQTADPDFQTKCEIPSFFIIFVPAGLFLNNFQLLFQFIYNNFIIFILNLNLKIFLDLQK